MRSDDFRFLIVLLIVAAVFGAALEVADQFFLFLTALAGAITAYTASSRKGGDE